MILNVIVNVYLLGIPCFFINYCYQFYLDNQEFKRWAPNAYLLNLKDVLVASLIMTMIYGFFWPIAWPFLWRNIRKEREIEREWLGRNDK